MLQIRTRVDAAEYGSRKAVVVSGTTSMSLSWISWKPRIDEPSNPMPSLRASTFAALGGTEKCCHTPGKSVNRRSTIWIFSSLIVFTRSSAVAQFGTMACSCHREGRFEDRVAVHPLPSSLGRISPDSTFGGAAPASIRLGGRLHAGTRLCRARNPAASALVRPTHELHGVFDMPPCSGQFHLALRFEFDGVLGSFGNRLRAVRFQQLSRIFMDLDFSHGVMLLSVCARP